MDNHRDSDVRPLLSLGRPTLRIIGVEPINWCRMTRDSRLGPWKYRALFEVLDPAAWRRRGQVVYFLTDRTDRVRHVGQSTNRLQDRWRESPMADCSTGSKLNMRALFHLTAWPAIEQEVDQGEIIDFTVNALSQDDLETAFQRSTGELKALTTTLTQAGEMSKLMEQWLIGRLRSTGILWNRQHATETAPAEELS
jgi:hypothetical protein